MSGAAQRCAAWNHCPANTAMSLSVASRLGWLCSHQLFLASQSCLPFGTIAQPSVFFWPPSRLLLRVPAGPEELAAVPLQHQDAGAVVRDCSLLPLLLIAAAVQMDDADVQCWLRWCYSAVICSGEPLGRRLGRWLDGTPLVAALWQPIFKHQPCPPHLQQPPLVRVWRVPGAARAAHHLHGGVGRVWAGGFAVCALAHVDRSTCGQQESGRVTCVAWMPD